MHCSSRPLRGLLALVALLGALAGCQSGPSSTGARNGPFFKPANFQSQGALPANLRRVVILPVAGDGKAQEATLEALDEALIRAITQAQRFESIPISRVDLQRFARTRSLRSVDVLPADFLQRIATQYGADAILFTDLTRLDPYAPIGLGFRCKLARIADQSLVWSIDETFDGAQAPVANSACRYWLDLASPDTPADLSLQALQSPSKFATYAFAAAFETIPSRRR